METFYEDQLFTVPVVNVKCTHLKEVLLSTGTASQPCLVDGFVFHAMEHRLLNGAVKPTILMGSVSSLRPFMFCSERATGLTRGSLR